MSNWSCTVLPHPGFSHTSVQSGEGRRNQGRWSPSFRCRPPAHVWSRRPTRAVQRAHCTPSTSSYASERPVIRVHGRNMTTSPGPWASTCGLGRSAPPGACIRQVVGFLRNRRMDATHCKATAQSRVTRQLLLRLCRSVCRSRAVYASEFVLAFSIICTSSVDVRLQAC